MYLLGAQGYSNNTSNCNYLLISHYKPGSMGGTLHIFLLSPRCQTGYYYHDFTQQETEAQRNEENFSRLYSFIMSYVSKIHGD